MGHFNKKTLYSQFFFTLMTLQLSELETVEICTNIQAY